MKRREALRVTGAAGAAALWLGPSAASHAADAPPSAPTRLSLDGAWRLRFGPQALDAPPPSAPPADWPEIAARVPGNVELDLARAGRLPPNLEQGNRVYDALSLELNEWWYERAFEAPALQPGQRLELVFEGLDCLATVFLDGVEVGRAANMLIAHRFDITGCVREPGSAHRLTVRLASAVLAAREHVVEPLSYAGPTNWEGLFVRKAPHVFGWDILPRLVSAGLWRGVALEVVEPTRFRSVYWATLAVDARARTADVIVDWDLVTERRELDGLRVRVLLARGGRARHTSEGPCFSTHGRARLALSDVDLWWPRGMGEAALHDATLELVERDGRVLARHASRIGIRRVDLERTDVTEDGRGAFDFVVNGERLFARGTNWVPLDALHSRDPQHLTPTFDALLELNCNMVRCWGGNVYEDHPFFDRCDAAGVLVWQDFALACAVYPQTDAFAEALRAEAEAVVVKLRNHASLALWAGNNEIDEVYASPGWSGMSHDPNLDRPSRVVLPEVVRRLDPHRDYLPSSPYRGPELVRRGGASALKPEDHLWGPRGDYKGDFYTGSAAHFVSEVGYHGCPERATLEQMLDPGHVWPWQGNDQWLTHAVRPRPGDTSYDYRVALMARQVGFLFDETPTALDDFVLASQAVQAEALKFFVERWRIGKGRRSGLLWWNLRDGWPVISDAVVDYYGRRKLACAYLARAQADVLLACGEAEDGRHALVAINDTRREATGAVRVRDADSGAVLFDGSYRVAANAATTVGRLAAAARPAVWLIEWDTGAGRFRNHYLAGPRPVRLADYARWLGHLGLPAGLTVVGRAVHLAAARAAPPLSASGRP